MARRPIEDLGANCPDQGAYYVCQDTPIRFMGCCTLNPCKTNNGTCPQDNLFPAEYDPLSHNQIQKQECVSDDPEVQWYTCAATDPPFMGCCAVNPCVEGQCPAANLSASRLSDDPEWAAAFLPLPNETSEPTETPEVEEGGLSTGAIVGIAVGATAVGLLLLGLLVFCFIKRRKRKNAAPKPYESFANGPPNFGSPNAIHAQERKFSQYSPYPTSSYAASEHPHLDGHVNTLYAHHQSAPPYWPSTNVHHSPSQQGVVSAYNSQATTPIYPGFRESLHPQTTRNSLHPQQSFHHELAATSPVAHRLTASPRVMSYHPGRDSEISATSWTHSYQQGRAELPDESSRIGARREQR